MYIHTFIHTYIHIYTSIHRHRYKYRYILIYTQIYIYIYIYIYICIFVCIYISFQKVPFLSFTKQINLCCTGLTTMAFQAKLLSHCFSKSKNYGYETFQNVAPILHSVICFEMNPASITNKRLL